MQLKNSLLDLTWYIFFKPWKGVYKVKEIKPKLSNICIILFFVGLFRGIFETMAVYMLANRLNEFFGSLTSVEWYLYNGGPFIVANVVSPYFFWATGAFIVYEGAKFLGGKGKFEDSIEIFGIFMISYLLIILLNFINLYLNIPFIAYNVSPIVGPLFGIGHIIVFSWFTILSYYVGKNIYHLNKAAAILLSPLPALSGISLYVFSSAFSSIVFYERTISTFFTLDIIYIVSLSVITIIIFLYELNKSKEQTNV